MPEGGSGAGAGAAVVRPGVAGAAPAAPAVAAAAGAPGVAGAAPAAPVVLARRLAAMARAASVAPGPPYRLVVLVDGRSGTGKTTLGTALAAELGASVVHLDDLYPGWDGLRAAAEAVVTDVLGDPSGYRRWDWTASEPADWQPVDPAAPLVVEGCGALSRASAPLATLRVWLEADDTVRWDRAIGRDGEVFAREWARWAAQEEAFIAAEDPAALADVVVRT